MNEGTVRKGPRVKRVQGFNKVSPQGVQREDVAGKNNWLRRLLGTLLCLTALALAAYFVADPVKRLLQRPLASVMVEGDFFYISKERAMELLSAELNGEFLQLDLMHLKRVLESEPWIEHAALVRRWPDALEVKITEQQPIARWGKEGFLNQRGEIIRVPDISMLDNLPLLEGDEINASEIMQQYQDMSQLLRSRQLDVVALKSDKKKSWRLVLTGDVEMAIGRGQVMEKMRRFITAYDQHLNKYWEDVGAIDVRYTNGVAVQWLPDSNANKKYIK